MTIDNSVEAGHVKRTLYDETGTAEVTWYGSEVDFKINDHEVTDVLLDLEEFKGNVRVIVEVFDDGNGQG